jgi:hypothetical protein
MAFYCIWAEKGILHLVICKRTKASMLATSLYIFTTSTILSCIFSDPDSTYLDSSGRGYRETNVRRVNLLSSANVVDFNDAAHGFDDGSKQQ